jgi:hypothetical protein
MPEDTVFDSTDRGTLRPNAKPLRKKGDAFYPMKLCDFGWEITLPEHVSPDDGLRRLNTCTRWSAMNLWLP